MSPWERGRAKDVAAAHRRGQVRKAAELENEKTSVNSEQQKPCIYNIKWVLLLGGGRLQPRTKAPLYNRLCDSSAYSRSHSSLTHSSHSSTDNHPRSSPWREGKTPSVHPWSSLQQPRRSRAGCSGRGAAARPPWAATAARADPSPGGARGSSRSSARGSTSCAGASRCWCAGASTPECPDVGAQRLRRRMQDASKLRRRSSSSSRATSRCSIPVCSFN